MKKILLSDKNIVYSGRIDFSDAEAPLFIWPGSSLRLRFSGGENISLTLQNFLMGAYSAVGFLIDGVQEKLELVRGDTVQEYIIATNLPEGEHELILFKRQAAAHYFRVCGLSFSSDNVETLPQSAVYKHRLEIYGDSVSAGEQAEALYYEAHGDPLFSDNGGVHPYGYYDNAWFSYPLILARMLTADVHDNAQGGIALRAGTGYFCPEAGLIGLESTWDKLSYVYNAQPGYTAWDFSRYIPDTVIIAIGQNDANPDREAINNPDWRAGWKAAYKKLVLDLNARYAGTPRFLLTLTVLMHEEAWETALDEVADELALPNVTRFRFTRTGKGTPGHPRATEQAEMAAELRSAIDN